MIIILKNCDGDNECFHYICLFWYDRYIILVATSGDTGSAVLDGFRRHAGTVNTNMYNCNIFISFKAYSTNLQIATSFQNA